MTGTDLDNRVMSVDHPIDDGDTILIHYYNLKQYCTITDA